MRFSLPILGTHELTPAWAWAELKKLLKFGIVGGSSFVLFISIYTLFSYVLWPDASRTLLTFVSSLLSSIYNFSVHRLWTFRSRAFVGNALARYLVVMAIATVEQTILFYIGHEVLHLFDYLVQVLVAAPVAMTTYVLHRWFTFHPKHGVRS
jgi:putative flippase GtrA